VGKGDESSKTDLAWFLLSGLGGAEKDADKAVALLEERVKDDDAEAMWMLGLCKEFGYGTEKDLKKGNELFIQSSERGSKNGKFLVVDKDRTEDGFLVKPRWRGRGTNNVSIKETEDVDGVDLKKIMALVSWQSIKMYKEFIWGNEESRKTSAKRISDMVAALAVNSSVTSMDLSCDSLGFCTDGVAEMLKGNTTLTELDLMENQINAEGAEKIGQALMVNTTLVLLYLGCNAIDDDGVAKISEGMKVNHSVTNLDLGRNCFGDGGADRVSEALKVNKSLAIMGLDGNRIGSKGMEKVCEALMVNTTLTKLFLAENRMSVIPKIGEVLKTNSTLKFLNMDAMEFGVETLGEICEGLKENSTLTELHMRSNRIEEEGLSKIVEALESNKGLTRLDMIFNTAIQEMTPKLKNNTTLKSFFLKMPQNVVYTATGPVF